MNCDTETDMYNCKSTDTRNTIMNKLGSSLSLKIPPEMKEKILANPTLGDICDLKIFFEELITEKNEQMLKKNPFWHVSENNSTNNVIDADEYVKGVIEDHVIFFNMLVYLKTIAMTKETKFKMPSFLSNASDSVSNNPFLSINMLLNVDNSVFPYIELIDKRIQEQINSVNFLCEKNNEYIEKDAGNNVYKLERTKYASKVEMGGLYELIEKIKYFLKTFTDRQQLELDACENEVFDINNHFSEVYSAMESKQEYEILLSVDSPLSERIKKYEEFIGNLDTKIRRMIDDLCVVSFKKEYTSQIVNPNVNKAYSDLNIIFDNLHIMMTTVDLHRCLVEHKLIKSFSDFFNYDVNGYSSNYNVDGYSSNYNVDGHSSNYNVDGHSSNYNVDGHLEQKDATEIIKFSEITLDFSEYQSLLLSSLDQISDSLSNAEKQMNTEYESYDSTLLLQINMENENQEEQMIEYIKNTGNIILNFDVVKFCDDNSLDIDGIMLSLKDIKNMENILTTFIKNKESLCNLCSDVTLDENIEYVTRNIQSLKEKDNNFIRNNGFLHLGILQQLLRFKLFEKIAELINIIKNNKVTETDSNLKRIHDQLSKLFTEIKTLQYYEEARNIVLNEMSMETLILIKNYDAITFILTSDLSGLNNYLDNVLLNIQEVKTNNGNTENIISIKENIMSFIKITKLLQETEKQLFRNKKYTKLHNICNNRLQRFIISRNIQEKVKKVLNLIITQQKEMKKNMGVVFSDKYMMSHSFYKLNRLNIYNQCELLLNELSKEVEKILLIQSCERTPNMIIASNGTQFYLAENIDLAKKRVTSLMKKVRTIKFVG
jgi:hypothetical protein